MRQVDARGMACPQPVILAKRALKDGDGPFVVLVDNEASAANVRRMAEKNGAEVASERREDGVWTLVVTPGGPSSATSADSSERPVVCQTAPTVFLLASDGIGRGDAELGGLLVNGFLDALLEVERCATVLVFMNSGVRLACEGSPVLEKLRRLADEGVEMLVCGTCLGHFGLGEKVRVGTVSNFFSITETLLLARSVVAF